MQEISDYMELALANVKAPRRAAYARPMSPEPYCLPPGCQGGGHAIRTRMEMLAQQCKNDEACLKSGLEKIWTDMQAGKMPWHADAASPAQPGSTG